MPSCRRYNKALIDGWQDFFVAFCIFSIEVQALKQKLGGEAKKDVTIAASNDKKYENGIPSYFEMETQNSRRASASQRSK